MLIVQSFSFQSPRSPSAQSDTNSTNKSRKTGKCLLGIYPSGTITFVSDVYCGNVSDKYITEYSNFLELIEEGDDKMADRGFTIRDLLTKNKQPLIFLHLPENVHGTGKGDFMSIKENRLGLLQSYEYMLSEQSNA